MRASRLWRIFAVLLALSLVAAACGDDDDDTGTVTDDTADDDGGEDGGDGDGGEVEGEIEVAEGTVINIDDCPSDWDPEAGLTDDEITLFMSLPESGPVAALGGLDDGMRAWFDQMEPIDGRTINLVSADDAYDPARTLSNVEDVLETNEPFAMTYMVGTPNVLAIRDLTNDECMPQLFNSTGFPAWGDPANTRGPSAACSATTPRPTCGAPTSPKSSVRTPPWPPYTWTTTSVWPTKRR